MVDRSNLILATEGIVRIEAKYGDVAQGLASHGEGLEIPVGRLEGTFATTAYLDGVLRGMCLCDIVGVRDIHECAEVHGGKAGAHLVFGQPVGPGLASANR